MTKSPKPLLLALSLSACIGLSGCWGKSAAQLIESSKASLQKKDYNAAAIELKSALQEDGNNPEARYLLGKALLEMGRPAEALIELTKAHELGYPVAQLVTPIGGAMIANGEAESFITKFGNTKVDDPKLRAEFLATLSTAYGVQNKFAQSREMAEAALQADPNNMVANLLIAHLLRVGGDNSGALAQLERTIKLVPQAGEPWLAKAELLVESGQGGAEVVSAYEVAAQRMPKNIRVYAGLIQELIRRRDLDGAQRQLALLEKAQPRTLQGSYLATLLAYERRDMKRAIELSQEMLRMAPDNGRFLHLAGAIEYERGNYLQAVAHLGKALNDPSAPPVVRLLLARAQLRAGDPEKALGFLKPLLEADRRAPAEVYSLAADAYLQKGDSAAAKKMFAKAVEINPADERGRTVLALAAMADGKADQGMAELKAIAGSSKGGDAEVVMVMAHVRANRFDDALSVVDGLERKRPNDPVAPYLRGRIEQFRGQSAKARVHFEQAASRNASFGPAVTALALLDLDDGKPAAAAARYEKLVVAAPTDVGARLGLIAARARAGAAPADVRGQLEDAVRLFPDSEAARATLVGTLLDLKDYQAALKAAKDGISRFPESTSLLRGQGFAELALGNLNQALQSFSKLGSLQPGAVEPLLYIADVHMAMKDVQAALAQLRKVVAMKPDYMPAHVRLVSLLVRLSRSDEAMAVARGVQKQAPNEPTGWTLEGDLLALKGNSVAAVAALKTAYAKRPSDESVIKLINVMRAAGQSAEAEKLSQEWLAKHPDSAVFNGYLGEQAIGLQDYERAERHLRKVIAVQPSSAIALNNLAWVLARAGKPGALEMGEKALALAPDSDAILDTLAEIHAQAGRYDKAIALQKRALQQSPNMPALRLHLAQYLIKAGQKSDARVELERLVALGSSFPGQEEVRKLLASL
jgi:putative PEP-CTERM system TPR-repeat lipoprotein